MKICLLLVASLLFCSCANFKDIGSNLGDGLSSSLQNRDSLFSSIGGNITKGARDSLINETLSRNLSRVLDSVVINFSTTSKRELSSLIDSLLSDYVAIRVARIGDSFQESVSRIPDNLLGERTSFLVRNLRNDLLGDSTASRLFFLRNELLGKNTSGLVDSLIASALNTVLIKYQDNRGMFREDLNFVQQNATTILITAGIVIVILLVAAGIIFYKKQKLQKVSEVLSLQIHNIPNQKVYDDLVKKIQEKAQENKVEPDLRKILNEQGILGNGSWKAAGIKENII